MRLMIWVLDLYERRWQGRRLRPDEYVISADEKSQLQALHRRHEDLAPAPGRTRRVEFEYRRRGTLAYLPAARRATRQRDGPLRHHDRDRPFRRARREQVMTREPYTSARWVFWVVDNGSSHAGQASVERMREAWPTAVLVHLPIHASWLNQVEIFFSIVQRKVIKAANFAASRPWNSGYAPSRSATPPPPALSTGATPRPTSTPTSSD